MPESAPLTGNAPLDEIEDTQMAPEEVKTRAMSGSVMVAVRGMAIRLLGLGGTLVLARLLTPRDFGLVAFGSTLLTVTQFLSAGGLGASLIRRPEPPKRSELRALLGIQLAGTIIISLGVAVVASQFGKSGQIVALMLLSMPLLVFRSPPSILLERDLAYRPLVTVEVAETVVFYVFAIVTVVAGMGVWGFAAAYIIKAGVGSMVMLWVEPRGAVRPSLAFGPVRGLIAFGLQYEAPGLVEMAFQQSLNSGVVAIAGAATLGIYSLSKAMLGVPLLLFSSLTRVMFPAMSRLLAAGEDPRGLIERTIERATVITGILFVPFVGAVPPLVGLLFGSRWDEAAGALPWASLGVLISAPISLATASYLYATGNAGAVLRSAIATTVADLAVNLALVGSMGPTAYGLGFLAAGIADVLVLGRAASRISGASVFRPMLRPAAIATVAGAAAWGSASAMHSDVAAAITGALVGTLIVVAGFLLAERPLLVDTAGTTRRAFAAALSRT